MQAADDFSYTSWEPFARLAAGQSVTYQQVGVAATRLRRLDDLIAFDGWGCNASDPAGLAPSAARAAHASVRQQAFALLT